MAKSQVYTTGETELSFNMTPMIDVTFQLIIFFLLAGTFASMDAVALDVPQIHEPLAQELKLENKVTVSVPPAPGAAGSESLRGKADGWMIGGEAIPVGDTEALKNRIALAKDRYERRAAAEGVDVTQPGQAFQIEIRADGAVNYSQVQPVIAVASELGIARMNLTTSMRGTEGQ